MYGALERLSLPAGAILFDAGDESSTAYLLMTGRLALMAEHEGQAYMLAERQAGDMVGEAAIVGPGPRVCSAQAITDCDLLVIRRKDISARLATADPLLRLCVGAVLGAGGSDCGELTTASPPSEWTKHFGAARDMLAFEHELRRAIGAGELHLFFQPIVALADRRLVGFETLLRWRHPERGLILPDDFIPMAEASGVICDITIYCIRQAGRLFPMLTAALPKEASTSEPLFVSVNVSGLDLVREQFAGQVASIIDDAGLDPTQLRLEVTESILMKNAERSIRTLQECRDQGIKVAIDDFGKGYSSLNYLNTLPVAILKLDRSFVNSLLIDTSGRKIIAGILRLGAELDLCVIAEGIEQEAEAEMLAAMGCGLGQGYLFGAPCDLDKTLALIRGWPGRFEGHAISAPMQRALAG